MAETKRVRIAVAIDEKGNFTVSGWNGATDDHMRASVIDFFEPDGSEVVHFIEADVPLPESITIEGKVRNG